MKTITHSQFEEMYGSAFWQQKAPSKSWGQETGEDIKQIGTEIASSARSRSAEFGKSLEAQKGGRQTWGETALQFLGQGAGLASETIGSIIKGGIKAVLPQKAEDVTKKAVTSAVQAVAETETAQSVLEKYNSLDERTKRNIDAALGLGSLTLDVALAGVGGKGATMAAKTATQTGARAIETGVSATSKLTTGALEKGGVLAEKFLAKEVTQPVKSALGESSLKTLNTYADIAEKAATSFKNKTPLEFAGDRAQEALDTIQRKLQNIGSTKSQILSSSKVSDKPVGNIVVKFRQDLNKAFADKTLVSGDNSLLDSIQKEAVKLGSNPTAKQVDGFIDFVQEQVYSSGRNLTIPVSDSTTSAIKKTVNSLNRSLKEVLPESYKTQNSMYSKLINIRNELNTKLGLEGEKGGALMKRVFSPSDANTKELFAEVKRLTGVDLVNEATIARYVMEVLGDTRQTNLLKQLALPDLSAPSILEWAKNWVGRKLNTPSAQIERARKMTAPTQIREI
jgi:hypothetical protein